MDSIEITNQTGMEVFSIMSRKTFFVERFFPLNLLFCIRIEPYNVTKVAHQFLMILSMQLFNVAVKCVKFMRHVVSDADKKPTCGEHLNEEWYDR